MHPHASRRRCLAAAALLAAVAAADPAGAQEPGGPVRRRVVEQRQVTVSGGHFTLAGANMLLSGLTGALLRWHQGGSFLDGFLQAASGGAAIYAGKALVIGDGAAPFLGRQLAAVGGSVVRNAGANEPMLSRVSLPFGPVHLHLSPRATRRVSVSVDVLGVAALSALLLTYNAEVDWGATLSVAAPVLTVHDREDRLDWNGRHLAGIVLVREGYWYEDAAALRRTLAHERVHLLQYDQLGLLWSDPAERALLEGWKWTRSIQPHVHLGLSSSLTAAARLLPDRASPIEIESTFLSQSR